MNPSASPRTLGRGWTLGVAAATCAGAVLLGTVVSTSAAFSDRSGATVNGAAGVSGRFDLGLVDGAQVVDAADEATALEVGLAPADEPFRIGRPVGFDVVLSNAQDSATGVVSLSLYDPDPVVDDLFAQLRFSVSVDGAQVASDLTADQVGTAGLTLADVHPGDQRVVHLDVVLTDDIARTYHQSQTRIGVRFEGMTTS